MANHVSILICFISCLTVFVMASLCSAASNEEREEYIVYMGAIPEGGVYSLTSQHATMLQQVIGTSSAADSLVRSYMRSFNGFAAKLTKDQKQKLANMKGVVSVFPNTIFKPQTTRSWDFMGFNETVERELTVESDVIVGHIDTGVWPESESFKDDGFGPPPKKWKGACKGGKNFTCNNKLIGARFYASDSARDEEGHGSHTASTAAGSKVKDASFYGIAKGTARGGVPSARIAAYKVCDAEGCTSAALLGAFDDAIADGVDIITCSIGTVFPAFFYNDPIAIGAFHAMAKGILTSHAAGNSGPDVGLISSVAPWIISVAASTFDRVITAEVVLGNGKKFVGKSVNSFSLNSTNIPLVFGSQAEFDTCSKRYCLPGCLDENRVKGKIVLCDEFDGILEGYRAGALGVITVKSGFSPDTSAVVPLPASALTQDDYDSVKAYYNSLKKPTAIISKSVETKDSGAPKVAFFSSRTPNAILPEILKPDVIAPGVGVFAAYSPLVSPSIDENDPRRVQYNLQTGTSMSCPHVTGLAAYVKTFHPDWSPSAIKSAIMTTAWPLNETEQSDAVYDHGSGHINPVKAINPGLVYDAGKQDYLKLLCSAGYSDDIIKQISGENITCETGSAKNKKSPKDLNYPSLTASVSLSKAFSTKFERTVTNVGFAKSTYKAQVSSNPKLTVKVVPEVLSFDALNQKKTFVVSITGQGIRKSKIVTASLIWSDGTHIVRSPIVAAAYVKPAAACVKPTLV